MPVADFKTYCAILDRARAGRFALPAINVTSLTTANAVLRGLAESKADGIIQVSTGGGAFASGSSVKDMALGAISIQTEVRKISTRLHFFNLLPGGHSSLEPHLPIPNRNVKRVCADDSVQSRTRK